MIKGPFILGKTVVNCRIIWIWSFFLPPWNHWILYPRVTPTGLVTRITCYPWRINKASFCTLYLKSENRYYVTWPINTFLLTIWMMLYNNKIKRLMTDQLYFNNIYFQFESECKKKIKFYLSVWTMGKFWPPGLHFQRGNNLMPTKQSCPLQARHCTSGCLNPD